MTFSRPFALALLLPSLALAHGAEPLTLDLFFADRGAGRQVFVSTTYGLIYEVDGEWVMACEESVSPGPKVWSVAPDGRFLTGHATGIAYSDDGCAYPSATGIPTSARSLEQAPGALPGEVVWWSVVDTFQPGRNLFRSTDGGASFQLVPLPGSMLANAARANPAAPGTLVVTAQDRSDNSYHLLVTTDFGETWASHPMEVEGIPRIAAVSPGGTLLVRAVVLDRASLYRSTDGGATFTKALELGPIPGAMTFLSNDVAWVAAGPGRTWRSTDGGESWDQAPDPGDLICLKEEAGRLYACVNDRPNNVAVKVSDDGGETWQAFLRWDEVVGMLACGAATDGAICEDYWLLSAIKMGIDIEGAGGGPDAANTGCECASGGAGLLSLAALIRRRRR